MSDRALSLSLADSAGDFERLAKWPLIEAEVPERPNTPEEQEEIQAHIELGIDIIRELLGNVDTSHTCRYGVKPDYYASDEYCSYRLLTQVLLPNARTVEQVRTLIAGFIINCVNSIWSSRGQEARGQIIAKLPQNLASKFRPIPSYDEMRSEDQARHRLYYHHPYICASTGHWARIPRVSVFGHMEDTLNLQQHRRYVYEPNHDCLQTIISDTRNVFCKHTGCTCDGLVERKIPPHKTMIPEKVARFLQLPGLWRWIDADAEMLDEAIASNLTIIAEYFAEHDEVIYKNGITKEEIDKWMGEKFQAHQPDLNVATYIWARFLGTEFEDTALGVEQYILALVADRYPWVFELAGANVENFKKVNGLFELYEKALDAAEAAEGGESSVAARLHDLLYMIPAKELCEAAMGSKNYRDSAELKVLHRHASDLFVYLPSKYTVERYETDFNGFCFDLFQELIQPLTEWRAIEGFELLDPMAIDGYSGARGWLALEELLAKVVKRMEEMKPSELLMFKKDVVDPLSELFREKALWIVTKIAEKWVVETSFEAYETGTLADMAMGAEELVRPALVLPGGIRLEEFLGKEVEKKRVDALAERAVLERHLKGVRGDRQIIEYLLRHRGTMVPVDLIVPRPDAPNLDIIKEFGSSPDLLALLSIATLLVYLGFDYDQVMTEVRMQAELASREEHPDLTTVGAECEQVSHTPEGGIVDPVRYGWLFNVLAMGGDRACNEVKTSPTVSTLTQRYIFALICDPRFQFINARMLWDVSAMADRCPNSIHFSTAIPRDLPFSQELVAKYMAPLQEVQWLMNGGKIDKEHSARGRIRRWRPASLLDVFDDKNTEMRAEFRSLSLDEKGDYAREMEMLQLVSSAAIQYMREKAGLKLSASGKVLAQMYERFIAESRAIFAVSEYLNLVFVARTLMEKYADLIREELRRPRVQKTEGIVIVRD